MRYSFLSMVMLALIPSSLHAMHRDTLIREALAHNKFEKARKEWQIFLGNDLSLSEIMIGGFINDINASVLRNTGDKEKLQELRAVFAEVTADSFALSSLISALKVQGMYEELPDYPIVPTYDSTTSIKSDCSSDNDGSLITLPAKDILLPPKVSFLSHIPKYVIVGVVGVLIISIAAIAKKIYSKRLAKKCTRSCEKLLGSPIII